MLWYEELVMKLHLYIPSWKLSSDTTHQERRGNWWG